MRLSGTSEDVRFYGKDWRPTSATATYGDPPKHMPKKER